MNSSIQTVSRQLGQYYEFVNTDCIGLFARQLGQYYELVNADYRPSRQLGQYYELVNADYRLVSWVNIMNWSVQTLSLIHI